MVKILQSTNKYKSYPIIPKRNILLWIPWYETSISLRKMPLKRYKRWQNKVNLRSDPEDDANDVYKESIVSWTFG